MTINVRHANTTDIVDLTRMAEAFFKSSPYSNLGYDETKVINAFTLALQSPAFIVLIAEEENKTVGLVAGFISSSFFNDSLIAAELVWWVDREARHKGVGQALHTSFEEWAKNMNCKIVTMIALEDNTLELVDKMYNKLGYRPAERSYIKEI